MRSEQRHELRRPVAAQSVTRKTRIVTQEALREIGLQVGEVAATAAGDANLLCKASRVIDQGDP